jgi:clan AA aspartic protease
MITGVVTASRQALIRLTVRGPEGQEQEIDAVIDTGFDGILTLPPALIATLGLVWRRRGRALLADGSESLFDIYETIIIWDGEPRRIAVDEADIDPLVGMSLFCGYELIVQAIQGGTVIIQPLPER